MSSNYWEGFTCPVCDKGFTLEQWDKRHNGKNGEEWHEGCGPECKDVLFKEDDEEDVTNDEFEAGG